jgi:N-acylneuraminate cytidylyltransferase
MYRLDDAGRLVPLLPDPRLVRRQDLPPVYHLNGAVYVARTDWLARVRAFINDETVGYEMPVDRSFDIDTERDFRLADALLRA